MQTANEIRSTFLGYFNRSGHDIVPSSSLVPRNDPTLMFTNAGMVQFKNVFTGVEKRQNPRAVSSQKCVRAGGKHNDLDNVGYTARHHTFFEMLGNFSFGDYFKETAIELAWGLITKEFGLPKDKLLVTVYHTDDEAAGLWKKIAGLGDDRIIRIATADNFWSMGETGPCGPCSEIFYDHGPQIAGGPPGSADEDGDRFIEIWNLVFMQYDQMASGERVPLPKPSIDTGMGLERLTAVLQGKHDNYDIDTMRALIEASAHASNTDPDGAFKFSHRVVADHLRSAGFLIADGVLPSNEGRGYVLRRIMRRAMRHAHLMGCREPLLYRLASALIGQMGAAYPELVRAQPLIEETLKLEETRFKVTLDRGLKLLDDETSGLSHGQVLSGEIAFKLYDTYGFPVDLTEDALRAKGIGVDMAGFAQAMERQKQEARRAWAGSGEAATDTLWFEVKDKAGVSEFLGYDADSAEGQIVALVKDGALVESARQGDKIALVANQTPFYGESGGQMGDVGTIVIPNKARILVTDTAKKNGDLIVHLGEVVEGTVSLSDVGEFKIDIDRRQALRAHHSATHLLHAVLRKYLGEHVTQKGSLVAPDRLRFDISHPKPLSADDIKTIERDVNIAIRANAPVMTRLMTPEAAIEAGAMALFGEKYGEEVRVVSMGEEMGAGLSTELCGGTHVNRTGDIGLFKIVSDQAVSSGVRRIEALVGEAALAWVDGQQEILSQLVDTLKTAPANLPHRVAQLAEDKRRLERELADAKKQAALGQGGASSPATKTIAGITFAGRVLDDIPARDLKGMADEIKKQIGSGVVTLISNAEGKASIVIAVSADLTATLSAVDLVRVAAESVSGKGGGGRPDMAQAGGPDGSKANDAMLAVEQAINAKLVDKVA